MNTEQLMDMLARNAGPAPRAAVGRRLIPAILLGIFCSCLLSLWLVGLLPSASFVTSSLWIKLGYGLALAVCAGLLAARLSRPVAEISRLRLLVWFVVMVMAIVGALSLSLTPADKRLAAVLGHSWLMCPWILMAFSLPALAGILWAVRGAAPTKLGDAGWASGLLAGALGALGYALACSEPSATFVAIWYTLGIMMTAFIGRLLGPIFLRW